MTKITRIRADGALFLVTLVWGGTFVLVKKELEHVEPMSFVAWRFLVASVMMIALYGRRLSQWDSRHLIAGLVPGVFLGLGFICQTIGMQFTSSGKAGFLTGLAAVVVPILSTLFLKRPPSVLAGVGVVIATVGLGFLSLEEGWTFGAGDLWIVACAVLFGMQIVGVAYVVEPKRGLDPILISVIQVLGAAVVAVVSAGVMENPTIHLPMSTWGAIFFLAAFATVFAFTVQTFVQRFTSPTHVVLIFAMEPVFAGFFGWWILDEVLSAKEIWGCFLILVGMLCAELRLRKRRNS